MIRIHEAYTRRRCRQTPGGTGVTLTPTRLWPTSLWRILCLSWTWWRMRCGLCQRGRSHHRHRRTSRLLTIRRRARLTNSRCMKHIKRSGNNDNDNDNDKVYETYQNKWQDKQVNKCLTLIMIYMRTFTSQIFEYPEVEAEDAGWPGVHYRFLPETCQSPTGGHLQEAFNTGEKSQSVTMGTRVRLWHWSLIMFLLVGNRKLFS